MNLQNHDVKLMDLDDSVELFTLDKKVFDAKIVNVYDGDTCYAVFMLYNTPVKFKIRMNGYDSPEMKPLLSNPNRDKEKELAIQPPTISEIDNLKSSAEGPSVTNSNENIHLHYIGAVSLVAVILGVTAFGVYLVKK